MESRELEVKLLEMHISGEPLVNEEIKAVDDNVQITCFTEDLHDVILYFQIIRFPKQIYAWIGCNSSKFGHLYAAAIARPSNTANVASLLGGNAENTGSSMARRMALKTGLNVVLACNIPKGSPILEVPLLRACVARLQMQIYFSEEKQSKQLPYNMQGNC